MLLLYDSCPLKRKVEPLIHSQSLHIGDSHVLEHIGSLDRSGSRGHTTNLKAMFALATYSWQPAYIRPPES